MARDLFVFIRLHHANTNAALRGANGLKTILVFLRI